MQQIDKDFDKKVTLRVEGKVIWDYENRQYALFIDYDYIKGYVKDAVGSDVPDDGFRTYKVIKTTKLTLEDCIKEIEESFALYGFERV